MHPSCDLGSYCNAAAPGRAHEAGGRAANQQYSPGDSRYAADFERYGHADLVTG
jgi:hypothetical protein